MHCVSTMAEHRSGCGSKATLIMGSPLSHTREAVVGEYYIVYRPKGKADDSGIQGSLKINGHM